ncbi:nucleotidyltransferase family protein [Kribbella sp. NPDC000426]|uniref:nucleotidyltransferase family protein n=1 Tax=Kribbella sp. NPDC000426 TaxID=3154255 RepID=UPI0033190253
MTNADSLGVPVAGLVLAAGAGRRMGGPKALVRDPAGVPWVVRASRILAASGCSPVVVVIGAAAAEVRAELAAEPVQVVEATNWPEGMSASLRAGLESLQGAGDAVVVVPVDLPGLTSAAVRRVLKSDGADALVRATYDGAPGHPVLIGRTHWDGVIASAHGDAGARDYLRTHPVELVACDDIGDGADADTPGDLPQGHR